MRLRMYGSEAIYEINIITIHRFAARNEYYNNSFKMRTQ